MVNARIASRRDGRAAAWRGFRVVLAKLIKIVYCIYPKNREEAEYRRRGSGRKAATLALMLATAMQAFDSTIVNVALPEVERSLGGGLAFGSWVMTIYLCAAAVTALLTGVLRRRFGAILLFAGAMAFFVLASLLCAAAASP